MSNQAVSAKILEVLNHRPSGFFSDFDGVLSEIAPTPDSAVAYPGVPEAVANIAGQVDVAGVITGRAVDDIASRIDIGELIVVGNHGLEWSERNVRHDHAAGVAVIETIAKVLDQVKAELASQTDVDRLIWENKRLSGTIHFRNTDDPAEVESLLLPIVQPLAEANGLRCTPGKMIVELRPTAMVTKGTALSEIIDKYELESAIFIGDDVTDVDGFRALNELRNAGKHTLSIGVVTIDAHPDVAAYADIVVGSVHEIVEVLSEVGEMIGARA